VWWPPCCHANRWNIVAPRPAAHPRSEGCEVAASKPEATWQRAQGRTRPLRRPPCRRWRRPSLEVRDVPCKLMRANRSATRQPARFGDCASQSRVPVSCLQCDERGCGLVRQSLRYAASFGEQPTSGQRSSQSRATSRPYAAACP
jgi:hypothetical protein